MHPSVTGERGRGRERESWASSQLNVEPDSGPKSLRSCPDPHQESDGSPDAPPDAPRVLLFSDFRFLRVEADCRV